MYAIEVNNLTKVYSSLIKKRQVTALKDFSLNVDSASFFGLLGPNGAGKTTLVKILLGITHLSKGDAKVLNSDISDYKLKKRIGYLPENHKLPPYLTGEQCLNFFGKFFDYSASELKRKIDELLTITHMYDWRNHKIKTYSKGMMQRLGLAQALLNDPELIFLDEPTDGVDPIGRKEIRNLLLELKNQGKTIFLNSHILQEVELVADRVAILNKGQIVRQGKINELADDNLEYKIEVEGTPDISNLANNGLKDKLISTNDNQLIAYPENEVQLNHIIDKLRSEDILIKSIIPNKDSLEDIFIKLINNNNGEK